MPRSYDCITSTFVAAFIALLAPSLAVAQASELARIVPSSLIDDEEYATSVSIDGDRAIVGSPGGWYARVPGRAVIFDRDGSGNWMVSAELTSSDGKDQDLFGASVAISGDRAIVGAPGAGGFNGYGAVYLFERNASGTWDQMAKFTRLTTFRGFGGAVAISGGFAVAGGTGPLDSQGLVQVFERDSCCWNYKAELRPSDREAGDGFGQSVSIDSTRMVVGADREWATTTEGAAYVFERDGGLWREKAKLVASDASADSRFGWSVSVDGDLIVVGASRQSSDLSIGGAAYVYRHDGSGAWNEVQKLTPSIQGNLTEFGIAASLDGTSILVGTAGTGNSSSHGAYVFLPDGTGSWSEAARLRATESVLGDRYGQAVSISGGYAVVGAPLSDVVRSNAGAAWVFDAAAVGVGTEVADMPATFSLSQNYPNPFNPSTTIIYTLPEASPVRLTVFDVLGREIRTPIDEIQTAGRHRVVFDASDLPSGVYLYVLRVEGHSRAGRMVLLR